MPKWLRSILIVILALGATGGAIYGVLTIMKNRSTGPVNVYEASSLCTDYSGAGQSETEGPVTTDRIQSVYISATQQVTEVFVTEGQEVKVGDPILAFDTTLNDLELERKRIAIEKLRLEISEAEAERKAMDSYRVYSGSVSAPEEPEEELLTPAPYMPYYRGGSGTAARPYVYLWNELCAYDSAFINAVLPPKSSTPSEPEGGETPPESGETPPESGETPPESGETPLESGEAPPVTDAAAVAVDGLVPDLTPEGLTPELTPPEDPKPEVEPPADPKPQPGPEVYVVFEQREENSEEGMLLDVWMMIFWRADDGSAVFTVTQPMPGYDEFLGGGDSEDDSYEDFGGGFSGPSYTWSELQQMKAEADQNIKDLKFQLKKAELEYEVVEYELSNGMVYSKIDGVVKTVRSPEAALADNEPIVLISGGGGYYVQGVMGELDLDYMQVGDIVQVRSWESGETMDGEIVEISQFPQDGNRYAYYWSQGNNNISKYPFKVFLPEDANLREHEYVNITFSRGESAEESVYLENPFLRRENGKSYVFARGEDGRLEQRFVTTGASLWGSYTEILEGLDPETDHLAFPYGKGVVAGAETEIAPLDELYAMY